MKKYMSVFLPEGKLLDSILPKETEPDHMEAMLCRVYGPISLERIKTRRGGHSL